MKIVGRRASVHQHLARALSKSVGAVRDSGMYLVYKYQQHKRHQQEQQHLTSRPTDTPHQSHGRVHQVTEKELHHLNTKIDKLLAKLEDHGESDVTIAQDDECVVCMCSKATMQTFPCGHKVVCRKCFVKTIQVAVAERALPLKCVMCRTKILKLKQSEENPAVNSPKKRHGIFTSSGSAKLSKPAMKARQFFLGSGGSNKKVSSSNSNRSHPVVTTKLMQPYLIYPSQKSPKQQRAFTTDSESACITGNKSYSFVKKSQSKSPKQASTDSPLFSTRVKPTKCSHQEDYEPRFTHLLSPRVTARCQHCPKQTGSRQLISTKQ